VSPSISVVIPHFGDPAAANALADRLLAQRPAAPHEIIVVDDASPQPFPDRSDVALVRRERNGGFGAAVNSGVEIATGDLLLVLNSDLDIDETFVADLQRAATPWMPAVVSPRIVSPAGRYEWTGRHFPKTLHYFVEWLSPLARFRGLRVMHEAVGHDTSADRRSATPVDWVAGAVMLMPLDAFRELGGFDESFHMYCEEVDLQRRMREIGITAVVVGEVEAVHEGGGSTDPLKRRPWLVRSRLAYARKWGRTERGIQRMLVLASYINWTVNRIRQLLGRDVDARMTLAHELSMIRVGR